MTDASPTLKPMHTGALLTTVFVTQFLVALDVALLNVALAAISTDLDVTGSALQWVVNAYLLTFAGFMLLGGRLGDLRGRRAVLFVGLALFLVCSVWGAAAGDAGSLIAARAGQGLAGALIAPQSLALIAANVPEGAVRRRALGLWGMAGAGGGAVGVVASGLLTETFGWRAVLAVNVPIVLVALVAVWMGVPRHERGVLRERLDVLGSVLVTTGVGAIVSAVAASGDLGWTAVLTLVCGGVGIALLVAFVMVERRSAHPIMPLRLFRARSIVGANVFGFLLSAGQLAAFYFCSLYMQQVWGITPALAGVLFLPFSAFVVAGIVIAQRLARRVGMRTALLVQGLVGAAGLAWFSLMPSDFAFWQGVVGPSLLAAVGIGGAFVLLGAAATSGVPSHDVGIASGVLNSSRQLGGTIGLAALVAVATARTGGAPVGSVEALADGYRAGLGWGAVLLAVGAVAAFAIMPPSPSSSSSPER